MLAGVTGVSFNTRLMLTPNPSEVMIRLIAVSLSRSVSSDSVPSFKMQV